MAVWGSKIMIILNLEQSVENKTNKNIFLNLEQSAQNKKNIKNSERRAECGKQNLSCSELGAEY